MAPRVLRSCFGGGNQRPEKPPEDDRRLGPVVLELFSSQGCTTSTEAEMLFSRIGRGDFESEVNGPLILLAYHVDYWNCNGWKDPFSSTHSTLRQKSYVQSLNLDHLFTPQAILQGRLHCLAKDQDSLLSSIAVSPRFPAPSLKAAFRRPSPDSLHATVTGSLNWKPDNGAEDVYVMVALYECGLVTDCTDGANRGRVMANDYVVRRLEKLCSVPNSKEKKTKKGISGAVSFQLWEGFNPAKCGMAVFVQDSRHQIFGSQKFQLPDNIIGASKSKSIKY